MTANSLGKTARRAFYEAMKTHAPSDALWEAAAGAVAEECAKVADEYLKDGDWDRDTCEAIGKNIRALKVSPLVEATTGDAA